MKVKASAPSNIALIKYMGKSNVLGNLATNPSISYTLPHLCSHVELEVVSESSDRWEALPGEQYYNFEMSEKGRAKFLNHLQMLKDYFSLSVNLVVRSANQFPSDCGIASSASSFAALTQAVYELARMSQGDARLKAKKASTAELARLSRKGSGSSCRSFFGPFCEWDGDKIEALSYGVELDQLHHMVVLSSSSRKLVSSSEAHVRVKSSLSFENREQRTVERLKECKKALSDKNWPELFETCWAEFWDMHSLFETSRPSFGYMEPSSLKVLAFIKEVWRTEGTGPVVTMDAGPNVHLLFKNSDGNLAQKLKKQLEVDYKVLSSFDSLKSQKFIEKR